MQRNSQIGLKLMIALFSIILMMPMVLLGFGFYADINSYIDACGQKDAINSGVVVEAEIVGSHRTGSAGRNSGYYRTLEYEYYDELNDLYYTGSAGFSVESDKVSDYIGQKIEIFIDGKGHSIAVGKNADTTSPLIVAILLPIMMIVYILFIVYHWKKNFKTKNIKPEQSDNSATDTLQEQNPNNSLHNVTTSQTYEKKNAIKKGFKFKLTINDELKGINKEIIDPTAQDIENAIIVLKKSYENFLILESADAIDDVRYLQAIDYKPKSDKVHTELRVKTENGKEINYSKSLTIQDFSNIMNDFLEGNVPDYRRWETENI